jgi:hypothetical protein
MFETGMSTVLVLFLVTVPLPTIALASVKSPLRLNATAQPA